MSQRRKQASRSTAPAAAPAVETKPFTISRADRAAGALVAIVALAVYIATAARDIVAGDTPELILAAVTLGVPHPPGYPLYTLLGHCFSLLPLGPVPFRLSLMAAVCGAAAVAFVYFTALRLTGNRLASAAAALVLTLTPLFWRWSIVAEVFSLNNALAAALVYFLATWHEQPERTRMLAAAALTAGLGVANQQTIVLLGPAVLFVLWRRRTRLIANPRTIALCAAAFAIGLLPYAYLPWAAGRRPMWNWGDPTSPANFLAVITRRYFGAGQLSSSPDFQGGLALDRLAALAGSLGILAGVLSLAGLATAWRRRRWFFWFTLAAFGFTGPIFAAYANLDVTAGLTRFVFERFSLLPLVTLAPILAFGIVGAASLAPTRSAAIPGIVVSIAAAMALANYQAIDQSANHIARRYAEDVFTSLDPHAILLMNGDEVILPLVYLQQVEHYRPDVALVVFPFLSSDWYLPQLRRQYPGLNVPFQVYDQRTGTLQALLEANPGRQFAIDGRIPEHSLDRDYWYHRHGLVDVIEPMSRNVSLPELIAETEDLLRRYRAPTPRQIKHESLEPLYLNRYAVPSLVVARECRSLHQDGLAAQWSRRALDQDPSLNTTADASAALAPAR